MLVGEKIIIKLDESSGHRVPVILQHRRNINNEQTATYQRKASRESDVSLFQTVGPEQLKARAS